MKGSIEWQDGTSLIEYLAKDSKRGIGFDGTPARFELIHELNEEWLILTLRHALWDPWSLPLVLKLRGQTYHGQALPQAPLLKISSKRPLRLTIRPLMTSGIRTLGNPQGKSFPKSHMGLPSLEQVRSEGLILQSLLF